MKQCTFLFLIPFSFALSAQNLVPNPSFEDTLNCPFGSFEIDEAVAWSSAGGSPDYFHSCASSGGASVPYNFSGYQYAASGNAYVGLYTFNRDVPWPGNREHIQTSLISPLTIGVKYYVSMDISFTVDLYEVGFATNKLGMLFTNNTFYNAGNSPPNNNNSQIFIDTVLADTANWYHFESSFIADSSYQHLLIGNFFDDNNTNVLSIDTSKFTAYYFVDNICVSSDSTDCLPVTNIQESFIKERVLLFPNPVNNGYFTILMKTSFNLSNINYSIFHSTGDIIQSEYISLQDGKLNINIDPLSPGIYFIQLQIDSEYLTKKFIVTSNPN